MNGLFLQLDDENGFSKLVTEHFTSAPAPIAAVMRCEHEVDAARVQYAHGEYRQNLEKFEVLLESSNPDHYKRAGALLHALSQSEVVVSVTLESTSEELESGFTRVNVGDAEHMLSFVKFYEVYYNEMLSFDLAYQCCAAYEQNPVEYDFDYLHNMCRYLKMNKNIALDTCFMLFKSLMHA